MDYLKTRKELEATREAAQARYLGKKIVTLCAGSGCGAMNSGLVFKALSKEFDTNGLRGKVVLRRSGCHGFCERGPILVIHPEGTCYLNVKVEDVCEIVNRSVLQDEKIERLMYRDEESGQVICYESDIPFYKHQTRVLLGYNEMIDPKSIEDYIGEGGYSALSKALHDMTPEQVIEEVKLANLRGRGGGGFSAGKKWETTRNASGKVKYVVVNADEGDPGAYMDRSLMEGNPHAVIEGLIIGGYAIGAAQGFVYIRQEYPLAVTNTLEAIRQAEEAGLLGSNILDSGFNFTVSVHRGAGAFVSGESSALVTALEGRVGEPKIKYIRTAVNGLNDKPTNLNNVETWANVPQIISRGADWFLEIGTKQSKGTKIFSLVGKVKNTGLVEVPMGMPLRDIIYKIGGGIRDGKQFKAVQTGGPSGGCIPADLLDVPVDFDELYKIGSMMGSGGMIVMDEDSCMVDVAKYFLKFLSQESCGKCLPCREGISQVLFVLNRITQGHGVEEDFDLLDDLSEMLRNASLCALGATAPNPLLSTLRHFHSEYEAHILNHECPAGVCKGLISYYIDPQACTGCTMCRRQCPVNAINGNKKEPHSINQESCSRCSTCFNICKFNAISRISPRSCVPETALINEPILI